MKNARLTTIEEAIEKAKIFKNKNQYQETVDCCLQVLSSVFSIDINTDISDILKNINHFIEIEKDIELDKIIVSLEFLFDFIVNGNCMLGNNLYSIEISKKVIHIFNTLNHLKAVASFNRLTGLYYLQLGEMDHSKTHLLEALRINKIINDQKGLANSYMMLGNLNSNQGNYDNAIFHYKESLKIQELINDQLGELINLNSIGIIYKDLKNYKLALEYITKSLILSKDLNKQVYASMALENIGAIYLETNDLDNAEKYFYESLEISIEIKDSEGEMYVYNNLGKLFIKKEAFNKAIFYMDKCLEIATRTGSKKLILQTTVSLGTLYSNKKYVEYDILKGENYLLKSIDLAKEMSLKNDLKEIYFSIFQLYEQESAWEKAMKYFKQYVELEKELFNEDIHFKVEKFAIERQELELEKNLKEQFAKQLINAQEQERQRIAKDLHDSVGQNILFIKNQLLNNDRNEKLLIQSIDQALEEVRTISKDLYPNQLEKYGLQGAVDGLCDQIRASSKIFISSDLQDVDVDLNKNAQINFFRIIQEFVNNTLKHADATSIRIAVEKTTTEIKLIVQDNGKGFDTNILEKKATKSFGLLNMEERIKMLKGTFNIESEIGKGTKSIFTIPI